MCIKKDEKEKNHYNKHAQTYINNNYVNKRTREREREKERKIKLAHGNLYFLIFKLILQ
jgi:hypothetical protein